MVGAQHGSAGLPNKQAGTWIEISKDAGTGKESKWTVVPNGGMRIVAASGIKIAK